MCMALSCLHSFFFFFFNDTATTEIYTLSLHDALPILADVHFPRQPVVDRVDLDRHAVRLRLQAVDHLFVDFDVEDRKSTRLNSSHGYISYAVFCLKKKKKLDSDQCTQRPVG